MNNLNYKLSNLIEKMITKNQINEFLRPKELAIAGVSRYPKKFGYHVFKELKEKSFKVYPINPNANKIDEEKCYSRVSELPDNISRLLILTPVYKVEETFQEAIQKGIKNIWIQQKVLSQNIIKLAKENSVNLIWNKCIFMFAEPVKGPHAFHRWLLKIFGKLPK